jgi:hypothetical protein
MVLAAGCSGDPVAQASLQTSDFGSLGLVDDLQGVVAELTAGKPSAGYGSLLGCDSRLPLSSGGATRQETAGSDGCVANVFLLAVLVSL